MTIKTKLIILAILLALIPTLILSTTITYNANQSAFNALEQKTTQRLTSLRELKKAQISDFISDIEAQISVMSKNIAVKSAAEKFIQTFHNKDVSHYDPSVHRFNVTQYYQQQFTQTFKTKNDTFNLSSQITQTLAALDEKAMYFQNKYIVGNPNPIGEKQRLVAAGNSHYDVIHSQYHSMFTHYLNQFGFYDLFIVDAKTGHIVYSVFKEVDFATSLKTGPYANSAIAKAFNQALSLKKNTNSTLVEFENYFPSYDQAASFIASPINNAAGQIQAVLIFQMPIDGINNIMTNNKQWQSIGLGLSGETYLVGPNKTLRSESRFLIENKTEYLDNIKSLLTEQTITKIKNFNSAIGLQKVDTLGVELALAGKTGVNQFQDYRGESVLSAYTPFKYGNHTWALLAEIDAKEAYADAVSLTENLIYDAIVALIITTIISVIIGLFAASHLIKPLQILVKRINAIAQGDGDLTAKLALADRPDEIGQVGKAFNTFIEKIRNIIRDIDLHASQLTTSSEELSAVTLSTTEVVNKQKHKTEHSSQIMTEFNEDIKDIANNSIDTAELTQQANTESSLGAKISSQAEQSILQLVNSVTVASTELEALNKQILEITDILNVIDSIADQTNLLSLNAAIEAARAGESGRGFSVVADEVRGLAAKTQQSTIEIQQKIQCLHSSSNTSVSAMQDAVDEAQHGIALVKSTAQNLQLVANLMARVSCKNQESAQVAHHQCDNVNHVHQNIKDIAAYTENTASASLQTSQASEELANLAVQLSTIVRQFKY